MEAIKKLDPRLSKLSKFLATRGDCGSVEIKGVGNDYQSNMAAVVRAVCESENAPVTDLSLPPELDPRFAFLARLVSVCPDRVTIDSSSADNESILDAFFWIDFRDEKGESTAKIAVLRDVFDLYSNTNDEDEILTVLLLLLNNGIKLESFHIRN